MKRNMHIYAVLVVILAVSSSQDVFEGYTLFTPQIGIGGGATTYLMDNNYAIIQSWEHSNGAASMPYLIPGEPYSNLVKLKPVHIFIYGIFLFSLSI